MVTGVAEAGAAARLLASWGWAGAGPGSVCRSAAPPHPLVQHVELAVAPQHGVSAPAAPHLHSEHLAGAGGKAGARETRRPSTLPHLKAQSRLGAPPLPGDPPTLLTLYVEGASGPALRSVLSFMGPHRKANKPKLPETLGSLSLDGLPAVLGCLSPGRGIPFTLGAGKYSGPCTPSHPVSTLTM